MWTRVFASFAGSQRGVGGAQHQAIGFYRRLERLLAYWGVIRRPSQTPKEWAELAAAQLPQEGLDPDLGQVPKEVVEAYYAVRFGRRILTEAADLALHARLDQLEKSQRLRGRLRFVPGLRRFPVFCGSDGKAGGASAGNGDKVPRPG